MQITTQTTLSHSYTLPSSPCYCWPPTFSCFQKPDWFDADLSALRAIWNLSIRLHHISHFWQTWIALTTILVSSWHLVDSQIRLKSFTHVMALQFDLLSSQAKSKVRASKSRVWRGGLLCRQIDSLLGSSLSEKVLNSNSNSNQVLESWIW